MVELTRDQKIYLIQKVDRYALSDMRREALKGYAKVFPISFDEINLIADFVCLQEKTVKEIAML